MRLDHLLSREQAKMETSELHTEVDEGKEIFRIKKKRQRRKRTSTNVQESLKKLLTQNTLYRLQGSRSSEHAHLDNCTVNEDSEKASCKRTEAKGTDRKGRDRSGGKLVKLTDQGKT